MSALGTDSDAHAKKMWPFFIPSNAAVEVTPSGPAAGGRAGTWGSEAQVQSRSENSSPCDLDLETSGHDRKGLLSRSGESHLFEEVGI